MNANALPSLREQYEFAVSDLDCAKRAATQLANALNDINNEIGELPEVYRIYSKVERLVDIYKNIDYDRSIDEEDDF